MTGSLLSHQGNPPDVEDVHYILCSAFNGLCKKSGDFNPTKCHCAS